MFDLTCLELLIERQKEKSNIVKVTNITVFVKLDNSRATRGRVSLPILYIEIWELLLEPALLR